MTSARHGPQQSDLYHIRHLPESSSSHQQFPLVSPTSPHDPLAAKIRVPTKATRRIRGEIACAECRRLKIRCDRIVPCSTCVKRGCGALCPNGTIPPGEGSRFVLAATDHLRQKLMRLEARMRSLEDALAIVHGSESDQPHTLLQGGSFLTEEDPGPTLKAVSDAPPTPVPLPQTLGTLWMDGQGGSRFFGPSGGSESLLVSSYQNKATSSLKGIGPQLQELDPIYLSAEINHCYQSFPFTPPNVVASSVQSMVEAFLPPMDIAITRCDVFLEHLSWMFHIVSRHQLVNEFIPAIYKRASVQYGLHDLALLLIVLGIGSLVDLNQQPYNLEAQHYYRLCRATMALQSVLGAPSVVTIKVLHLMSIYNGMSGKESNLEQSYILLDLAGQVALRIGFHIDPSLWGFEGREAYDRRVYFWNLMAGVLWQSLVTGRPPSLLMSYIDCRIPNAEDEDLFQEGEVPLGFGIWGFKATVECLIPLVRLALATTPPTYESVMELDQKIRELASPRADLVQANTERTAISMRAFVRSHYQELMLLFLHRSYFVQAMTEHPENPMNSPYSQSVHAAYSSACAVLQDTKSQFTKKPLLCARIWRLWSFTFTAAVIVGTLAIRGTHLDLKPPPLEQFEAIFKIFTSAAETGSRAARALPVLQAMLLKARQAHQYYYEKGTPAPSTGHDMDELSLFGGETKFIQQSDSPARSVIYSQTTSSSSRHEIYSNCRPLPHSISSTPPPSSCRSRKRSISPPTPIAQPLASKPISIPLAPLTYPATTSRTNSSVVPVSVPIPPPPRLHHQQPHSQQISMERLTPVMVPSMRSAPAESRTFADLSGGWDGMFHEVPSYTQPLRRSSSNASTSGSSSSHNRNHNQPMESLPGIAHSGQMYQAASQARGPNQGDQVMLDDRWASFMNYDVLREPTQYHQHQQT